MSERSTRDSQIVRIHTSLTYHTLSLADLPLKQNDWAMQIETALLATSSLAQVQLRETGDGHTPIDTPERQVRGAHGDAHLAGGGFGAL